MTTADISDVLWYRAMPKEYKDRFERLVYTATLKFAQENKDKVLEFFRTI